MEFPHDVAGDTLVTLDRLDEEKGILFEDVERLFDHEVDRGAGQENEFDDELEVLDADFEAGEIVGHKDLHLGGF